MEARRATCMGSFQFRRTSTAPSPASQDPTQKRDLRRATTKPGDIVWDADENKPVPAEPAPKPALKPAPKPVPVTAPAQSSEPTPTACVEKEPVQPKRKRRKKAPLLDLKLDPSLPEEKRLLILIERTLQVEYDTKYANAPESEREEFKGSMMRVVDLLQSQVERSGENEEKPQDSEKYTANPANDELAKREAQLKAIIASYEKELEQWEAVQGIAEKGEISAVDLPEVSELSRSDVVPNFEEVLSSSNKAVESFILETDHVRAVLKKLESRNRTTKHRVREIAEKLNDRVMAEFGSGNESELIPPSALTVVETKDLAVATGDA